MNPEMDTSKMRVPLQGAVKIFEAGIKSKTWDIHGMPQFITMTHHEGCEMCNMYASHVVKASEASMVEIPSREVKKAFRIAWPVVIKYRSTHDAYTHPNDHPRALVPATNQKKRAYR